MKAKEKIAVPSHDYEWRQESGCLYASKCSFTSLVVRVSFETQDIVIQGNEGITLALYYYLILRPKY